MLYRDYKPKYPSDVIGQDEVVNVLCNQIINDTVAHAYIFSGIHGTGKTTLATLFAKAINCSEPKDGSPCGQCLSCKDFDNDQHIDIHEIDAASNNGVDFIRELTSNVSVMPSYNKSVYIIDEAHMLSKAAFNALLKTLEAPPSHVVFMFCTTESHKIIDTIKSRCQTFTLNRIETKAIASRLVKVVDEAGIARPETEAVELISRIASGSMRKALSILDALIYDPSTAVTVASVRSALGLVDDEAKLSLTKSLICGSASESIALFDEAYGKGAGVKQLAQAMNDCLKDVLLVISSVPLDASDSYLNAVNEMAGMITKEQVASYMKEMVKLLQGNISKNEFEMFLLMAGSTADIELTEVVRRVDALDGKVSNICSGEVKVAVKQDVTEPVEPIHLQTPDRRPELVERPIVADITDKLFEMFDTRERVHDMVSKNIEHVPHEKVVTQVAPIQSPKSESTVIPKATETTMDLDEGFTSQDAYEQFTYEAEDGFDGSWVDGRVAYQEPSPLQEPEQEQEHEQTGERIITLEEICKVFDSYPGLHAMLKSSDVIISEEGINDFEVTTYGLSAQDLALKAASLVSIPNVNISFLNL